MFQPNKSQIRETGQYPPAGTLENRRGSPIDRRPSTDEAPPIGTIHPFSKITITLEPVV